MTTGRRITSEVHIVRETMHHRAHFDKAFSSILPSPLAVRCVPTRKVDSLLEQTRDIHFDFTTVRRSLTGKLGLNLGFDVNDDNHVAHLSLHSTLIRLFIRQSFPTT
jgi:hypothetical protein